MKILFSLLVLEFVLFDAWKAQAQSTPSYVRQFYKVSPFHWAITEYPESDFERSAIEPPFQVGRTLNPSIDVERRLGEVLQSWADDIHQQVGQLHQQMTGASLPAPRPIIRVVQSKNANAWASSIPICVNKPATFIGTKSQGLDPDKKHEKLLLLPDKIRSNLLGVAPGQRDPECAQSEWSGDADQLEKWFNSLGGKCTLSLSADGERFLIGDRNQDRPCELSGITRYRQAEKIMIYASSPVINLTSAFLAMADSYHAVLTTVAHELGHYYYNHTTLTFLEDLYDYWYSAMDSQKFAKPLALPDSNEINQIKNFTMPIPEPRIEEAYYDHRMYRLLMNLAKEIPENLQCTGPDCQCRQATQAAKQRWAWDLDCFGCGFVEESVERAYLDFEFNMKSCSRQLDDSSFVDFRDLINSSSLENYFREEIPLQTNLFHTLEKINDRLIEVESAKIALMTRIEEQRLGQFTSEQQADEFAMEFVYRLGLDSQETLDSIWNIESERAKKEGDRETRFRNSMTWDRCAQLRKRDWKTENGKMAFVPLGNLHDHHHSGCYRLFNRKQVLDTAKQIGLPKEMRPELFSDWPVMRIAMDELSQSMVIVTRPGGGPRRSALQPTGSTSNEEKSKREESPLIIDHF